MDGSQAGSQRLFVVYLGGDPVPGRLSEDHEVVMVAAGGLAKARSAAKAKWGGHGRAHVDAVQMLDVVDGYAVRLEYTGDTSVPPINGTYVPAED